MKWVISFLGVATLTLVSGCATRSVPIEDDPDYKFPAGTVFILNKPLTIPADRRSVYIFRGAVTPFSEIDVYYPYCQFRLRKISGEDRVVPPGRFVVIKTVKWDDYTDRRKTVPRLARRRAGTATVTGQIAVGEGGPPTVAQATIVKLRSDTQQDVDDLVCRQWGDQGSVEHVTVRQMRSALGNIMTVVLGNQ